MKKHNEIVLALLLGFICPVLLFWAVEKIGPKPQIAIEHTTTVGTTQSEHNDISVVIEDCVVSMPLEEYIVGVVLKEMPANFEMEALKAQAVVARTYTLKRLASGGKHENAAVCTNASCCQGFCSSDDYLNKNGNKELLNKVKNAVSDTEGQVLLYNGQLIEATYFSCSGGKTEDAKAVWGSEIPYLQSTQSPGEEKATHYVDTVKFTLEEFKNCLDIEPSGNPRNWIGETRYTQGGGVDTMYICGKEFKGTTLRQKLGLRSTAFLIAIVGSTVSITTKGYGHRVGMSQYGADAMAVQGSTYTEILAHYYQNTELVTYDRN